MCAECILCCTLVQSILSEASTSTNHFNCLIFFHFIFFSFFLVVNDSKFFFGKGLHVIINRSAGYHFLEDRSAGYHQKISMLSSNDQQVIRVGNQTNRTQLYNVRCLKCLWAMHTLCFDQDYTAPIIMYSPLGPPEPLRD